MTARPGGWVPGIGWVALRCHLAPGDFYKYDQQDHRPCEVRGLGWKRTPVIVTRWADGTVPEPPEKPDVDGADRRAVMDPAMAYLIWRIDCPCGEVTDLPDGDEAPTECPECGRPVEVGVT